MHSVHGGTTLKELLDYGHKLQAEPAGAKPPSDPGFPRHPCESIANLGQVSELQHPLAPDITDRMPRRAAIDPGCGEGGLSLFLERAGFRVNAVDCARTIYNALPGARRLLEYFDSRVRLHQLDLDSGCGLPPGEFGIALCPGLPYHLKNPLLVLEQLDRQSHYRLLSTRILTKIPGRIFGKTTAPPAYLVAPVVPAQPGGSERLILEIYVHPATLTRGANELAVRIQGGFAGRVRLERTGFQSGVAPIPKSSRGRHELLVECSLLCPACAAGDNRPLGLFAGDVCGAWASCHAGEVNLLRRLPAFRRIEAELERLRAAVTQHRQAAAALAAERDEMHNHALRLDRELAEGLARERQMTAELADAADHIARLYDQRDALQKERDELRDHLARIEHEKAEREARMVSAEARLAELNSWLYAPPGHFYSPIVNPSDPRVAGISIDDLNALDGRQDLEIDEPRMIELLERMGEFYADLPWARERRPGVRFLFDNPNFAEGDAITLYGLLRLNKPRRFLEIGCGYSSLASMDVNDLFLGGTMDTLYVDPFPETLEKLLDEADPYRQHIRPLALQDVPLDWFTELEAGDIVFIDSSHVLKTGSDVCDALFRVLPALAPGVIVHFHDVVYPFEYPPEWIRRENRSWNEVYALRAFLQYNRAFRILFFNSLVYRKYPRETAIHAPLCARNAGGGLWLEKA